MLSFKESVDESKGGESGMKEFRTFWKKEFWEKFNHLNGEGEMASWESSTGEWVGEFPFKENTISEQAQHAIPKKGL